MNPLGPIALVTPSHAGDYERCRLCVESADHCVEDIETHYVMVSREDYPLFRSLRGDRLQLVCIDDFLPRDALPHGDGKPVSGWILQQLVKLASFDVVAEDAVVLCDSDNAFVCPVRLRERLFADGKALLFRASFDNDDIAAWNQVADEVLGLRSSGSGPINYVTNLVTWLRSPLLALRQRLENVMGRPWLAALACYTNFSEYTIYGRFVEELLGTEAAGHVAGSHDLILASWNMPLRTPSDIEAFWGYLTDRHAGVMIHSKDEVPIESYSHRVQAGWPKVPSKRSMG